MAYSWPGNVRELENVVERALILRKNGLLMFEEFRIDSGGVEQEASQGATDRLASLDGVMRKHIIKALNVAKGKIHGNGGAAELIGVNPNTLRSKMRRLGIPFKYKG